MKFEMYFSVLVSSMDTGLCSLVLISYIFSVLLSLYIFHVLFLESCFNKMFVLILGFDSLLILCLRIHVWFWLKSSLFNFVSRKKYLKWVGIWVSISIVYSSRPISYNVITFFLVYLVCGKDYRRCFLHFCVPTRECTECTL